MTLMRESAAPQRIEWIDFAKGICIFLVVMLHTTHFVEEHRGFQSGWLDYVVSFAKPFRMPDFFLLSGLLLGRVIDRPWRRYLDTKVVHFLYFFVLWEAILYTFFYVRVSWSQNWPDVSFLIRMFLRDVFVESSFPLWFIHSLPIYFLVTRLIRNWSPVIVLALLVGLHSFTMAHSAEVEMKSFVFHQFSVRYIYFYSGYLFASHVFRIADWASSRRLLVVCGLILWGFANQWFVSPPEFAELPLVSLLAGYAGAMSVIMVACLASRIRFFSWLEYLGKNSIVVYLTFMLPMAVINKAISGLVADVGTACLITTIGSVAASILVFWVVRNTPLRFLYIRPNWAKLSGRSPVNGAVRVGAD